MTLTTSSGKTLKQYRGDQNRIAAEPSEEEWENDYLDSPQENAPPERALWRAVFLQMFTDALSNSQKPEQRRHRQEALQWLTSHSREFRQVCEFAGYNPQWMQGQINRFFASHTSLKLPPTVSAQKPGGLCPNKLALGPNAWRLPVFTADGSMSHYLSSYDHEKNHHA